MKRSIRKKIFASKVKQGFLEVPLSYADKRNCQTDQRFAGKTVDGQLGLIDMKVENEVQKVIHKLEQIDKGLNLKYNVLLGAITLLTMLISIFKFLG